MTGLDMHNPGWQFVSADLGVFLSKLRIAEKCETKLTKHQYPQKHITGHKITYLLHLWSMYMVQVSLKCIYLWAST